MSKVKPYFYDPDSEEKIYVEGEMIVGRSDERDFQVRDQSVSSSHAKIIVKGEEVFVVDLDSFNSSYINGEELEAEKKYPVFKSDVVQFGDKFFYFSSIEPCQKFLDLPSLTGSMKMKVDETGQAIVHNYDEPILGIDNKRKITSLKELRLIKDQIDTYLLEIKKVEGKIKIRENTRRLITNKEKELDEFKSYLEARQYNKADEVEKIIQSVGEVSERLVKDTLDVEEKINILRNQIEDLKSQMLDLKQEEKNNEAIVNELRNDIEIIRGRDSLLKEIEAIREELSQMEGQSLENKINELKKRIKSQEEFLKESQKNYAETRFGKKAS